MYFPGGAGSAIASDASGNTYILAGSYAGSDLPAASCVPCLLKFNAAGALQYAANIGARAYDAAAGPDGSAYVVASRSQTGDVFVMKVDGSGSVARSTNIPALTIDLSDHQYPSIAVTAGGAVVVAGAAVSDHWHQALPTVDQGDKDAAVVTVDAAGTVTTTMLIGGSGLDAALDVAVDAAGNIYVAGFTQSDDFPVTAQAAHTAAGSCRPVAYYFECEDAFVAEIDARGHVVFATRYGGSYTDRAVAVRADRGGGVYVAGNTSSRDFPVVRAAQASPSCPPNTAAGCARTFVMRFDRSGSSVAFATYLGGTAAASLSGLSVDPAGNAYVVGLNNGNDFPVRRAPQPDNAIIPMLTTEDGGRTWAAGASLRANVVNDIAWSIEARPIVFASTDTGLFASTDYGRTWTERRALATRHVGAIAVDPMTPAIVYASVPTEGIYDMHPGRAGDLLKSLDGGQSWTPIHSGLSETARGRVASIALARSRPGTMYLVADGRVYASDDGGSNWRGGTDGASALAVDPTNASRVYATDSPVVKVSTDGARSWRTLASAGPRAKGSSVGRIVVNPLRPTELWVGLDTGVAKSRDAGEMWEGFSSAGDDGSPYGVAVDPITGDAYAAKRTISRLNGSGSTPSSFEARSAYIDLVSAYGGKVLAGTVSSYSGFVTAFDADGAMMWSTHLGGTGSTTATAVSAETGTIYVTGGTAAAIWPLAQAGPRPAGAGFLARYVIPR